MSQWLRYLARRCAYLIALLLAAVWTVGGMELPTRSLYDLGRPLVGDVIISARTRAFAFPPDVIIVFALMLVGLKFMVGALLLLAALFRGGASEIYPRIGRRRDAGCRTVRRRARDDSRPHSPG